MQRLSDTLYNILDSKTGEAITYNKVTTFTDGSAMTDAKTDGVVYVKSGDEYFKRVINGSTIYAAAFGFLATASALENTLAAKAISDFINRVGGGVTIIFEGVTYTIGYQLFAGQTGLDYAYAGKSIFEIHGCNKEVIFESPGGTVFKMANGLRFGSFDPVTGNRYDPNPGGFTVHDFKGVPNDVFNLYNNDSVTLRNIAIDGNLQNLTIGGYYGDVGIQLAHSAFRLTNNKKITLENVQGNYFGLDGITLHNDNTNVATPVQQVFVYNSKFYGNARQGLSWTGGNHFHAEGCEFSGTAKTVNIGTGAALYSQPGAGVDMEAEGGNIIRNGTFVNCNIDNNINGFLSVGDVADITFTGGKIVGTTGYSIYGSGARAKFNNTIVVGAPVNLYTGTGPFDTNNTKFNDCLFTMDAAYSPTGVVYGNYLMELNGSGGFFTNCTLDSYNRGTPYGGLNTVCTNCTIKQLETTASGYDNFPYFGSNFYGVTRLYWFRGGYPQYPLFTGTWGNLDNSKVYGPFYMNDVEVSGMNPDKIALTLKGTIPVLHLTTVPTDYADNAAALAAGKVAGDTYRTGDVLKVVH